MALNHNMKQTFFAASLGKPLVNATLANALAIFYLNNTDPSEEGCVKFAEENCLDSEVVLKYIQQRKRADLVNQNLLNLKFGMKYIRPEESLIKDFEKRSQVSEMSGFISENIPKKVKKLEFQVINEDTMHYNPSTNQKSTSKSSHPSKNQTTGQETSNVFKIEDAKDVQNIISLIKKENKLENRLKISLALRKLDSSYLLNKFVTLNGNQNLGYWIEDYKEEIESRGRVEERVYEVLNNILTFCNNLPITVHELKTSKIGKKINKLGKCVEDKYIKHKCEELVSRWKKLIENIKDKKHKDSKETREHKSSKEKKDDSHSHHRSHSSSRSRSTSQEMIGKTKRDSKDFSISNIQTTKEEEKNNKKYITISYLFLYSMLIKFTHKSLSYMLRSLMCQIL